MRIAPCLLALFLILPVRAEDASTAVPLLEVVRVAVDAQGKSYFATGAIALTVREYAPPAPALAVSERLAASDLAFAALPAGYYGDWHPAPRRQYGLLLSGTVEVETGDGARRSFSAGSVFLLEDTTGQGHRTRVVGDQQALIALVPVPEVAATHAAAGAAPHPHR